LSAQKSIINTVGFYFRRI